VAFPLHHIAAMTRSPEFYLCQRL